MFWLNSRSALVTATSHFRGWHPLSRSYGANLPSSLTNVKPDTPRPSQPGAPVSVLGTDTTVALNNFSRAPGITGTRPKAGSSAFASLLTMTVLQEVIDLNTATAVLRLATCVIIQTGPSMVQEY